MRNVRTDILESICLNCSSNGTVSVESKYLEHYKENMFIFENGKCKCIKCKSDLVLLRDFYTKKIVKLEWI